MISDSSDRKLVENRLRERKRNLWIHVTGSPGVGVASGALESVT